MTLARGCRLALVASSLALAIGCALLCPEPPPPAPEVPVPPATASVPPPCERIVRIEVRKHDRILRAFCARGAVVEMTAAMSRRPVGPKRVAGDLRTPEGLYRISEPARESRFHRFIPIDYPSRADADAALATGQLSARDHARILEAHAAQEPPPGDTPLGGAIGLHGEGPRWHGYTEGLNWTLGCVAVTDEEIDFLVSRTEMGTPVEILP